MAGSSFLDVCRFNPTLGGTTDWTFSSAVQGYQSPSAAGVINGAQYSYRAESADLSQWEVGTGTYNTSTGVLSRTAVLFNSSGGTSKISFSAAPQVAVVALAEDLLPVSSVAPITASLGADVALNVAANYFDGPSIAQGSVGTWFVSGTVTLSDTTGTHNVNCKLWDGTTIIASAVETVVASADSGSVTLSGFITSPAGNLRISCRSPNATGVIQFNQSGNSKDSTISAFRIK